MGLSLMLALPVSFGHSSSVLAVESHRCWDNTEEVITFKKVKPCHCRKVTVKTRCTVCKKGLDSYFYFIPVSMPPAPCRH